MRKPGSRPGPVALVVEDCDDDAHAIKLSWREDPPSSIVVHYFADAIVLFDDGPGVGAVRCEGICLSDCASIAADFFVAIDELLDVNAACFPINRERESCGVGDSEHSFHVDEYV